MSVTPERFLPLPVVADVLGVSRRTLERRVSANEIRSVPGGERAPNGRTPPLLDVAALPPDERKRFQLAKEEPRPSRDLDSALARFEPDVRAIVLAEANRRAELVELFRRIDPKKVRGRASAAVLELAQRFADAAPEYLSLYPSAAKPPSLATLFRLSDRLEAEGLAALIRSGQTTRTDDGRCKPVERKLVDAAVGTYLNKPGLSIASIHRAVVELAQAQGLEAPSYARVCKIIRAVPQGSKVRHRVGRRAYEGTASPFTPRSTADTLPRQILCGDHHQFDVFCRDESGNVHRPWLTAWVDVRSWVLAGFVISFRPNSDTIARAFRHAIVRKDRPEYEQVWGIPVSVYVDNGKDYTGRAIEGRTFKLSARDLKSPALEGVLREHRVGLLAELDVKVTHAKPYNAKAKIAERFFGFVAGDFSPWVPGWCGADHDETNERVQEILGRHRRWVRGEPGASTPLLTLEQFRERFETWLLKYHQGEAGHRVDDGGRQLAPLQVWNLLAPAPRAIRSESLEVMLWRTEVRTVQKNGIQLNGGRWYYAPELVPLLGHKVEVRVNPDEAGRIAVYVDARFLCWASSLELLSYNATAADLKREGERKKQARKVLEQYAVLAREHADGRSELARIVEHRDPPPTSPPAPAAPQTSVTQLTRHDRVRKPARRVANGGPVDMAEGEELALDERELARRTQSAEQAMGLEDWTLEDALQLGREDD